MMHIRVIIKNWLPVTAEVAVRPEAVGIFRLGTKVDPKVKTRKAKFKVPLTPYVLTLARSLVSVR
jgi:hypothetical protein